MNSDSRLNRTVFHPLLILFLSLTVSSFANARDIDREEAEQLMEDCEQQREEQGPHAHQPPQGGRRCSGRPITVGDDLNAE